MSIQNKNAVVEYYIFDKESPQRIEEFAREVILSITSNKGIKKAIIRGQLQIDSKVVGTDHWMKKGETLILYRLQSDLPIYERRLEVYFEDDHMAVVFKPAGLSVHNNQLSNLINALSYNLNTSELDDALDRPFPIHRLDQQTSGLIIVAKTRSTLAKLNENLKNGEIDKYYMAIVNGNIENEGTVDFPIEGKECKSKYWPHSQFQRNGRNFTLLKLQTLTGRTHQLRIHLAGIDHSIVGDRLYGNQDALIKGRGLFLCANHIVFKHPANGKEIAINSELPKKFQKFIPPQF